MTRSTLCLLASFLFGCSGSSGDTGTHGQPLDPCTSGSSQSCVQGNGNAGVQACKAGDQGFVWGSCEAAACTGNEQSCETASGEAGVAACVDGKTASACGVIGDCHPGASTGCGACKLMGDTWALPTCGGSTSSAASTPLVLVFGGEGVTFTHPQGAFDVFGSGTSLDSSWVSAETPWLALDRNGNGRIDDGSELFGSMTELPDGARASNGFVALAALDEDGDGKITAADPAFAQLVVWRDRDQNRESSPGELVTASEAGLVSIDLDYRVAPRCVATDCEIERARFVFHDDRGGERAGQIVDVHFTSR